MTQLLWSQRAIHLIALCSLAFVQADLMPYAVVETLLTSSGGSDKGAKTWEEQKHERRKRISSGGNTRGKGPAWVLETKKSGKTRISRNKNIKETLMEGL